VNHTQPLFSRKPTIPIWNWLPFVDSKQKTWNSQIFRGGNNRKKLSLLAEWRDRELVEDSRSSWNECQPPQPYLSSSRVCAVAGRCQGSSGVVKDGSLSSVSSSDRRHFSAPFLYRLHRHGTVYASLSLFVQNSICFS
jgi:hypothetical protein